MKQAHYSASAVMRSRAMTGKATRSRLDAQEVNMRLHHGVPVIDCDGAHVAIVTGTPGSFKSVPVRLVGQDSSPAVVTGSRRHRSRPSASYLGTTIDAVIGGDLLQQFECLIDLGRKRVVLSHGSLGCDGVSLRTPLMLDVPTAEITVGARQGVAFLDTGARLSYMDPAAVTGRPVGREKDFFPLVGEFETDIYEVEMSWQASGFVGDSVCCRRRSSSRWRRSVRSG